MLEGYSLYTTEQIWDCNGMGGVGWKVMVGVTRFNLVLTPF